VRFNRGANGGLFYGPRSALYKATTWIEKLYLPRAIKTPKHSQP